MDLISLVHGITRERLNRFHHLFIFFCVRKYQDKVHMKEYFRKSTRKIGNIDVKNIIMASFVQE